MAAYIQSSGSFANKTADIDTGHWRHANQVANKNLTCNDRANDNHLVHNLGKTLDCKALVRESSDPHTTHEKARVPLTRGRP